MAEGGADEASLITSRKPKGTVLKGTTPIKQVPGYKPVSSIPAKFETVLFTGPREKKGFLAISKRFVDHDTDAPGPGAYERAVKMDLPEESASKKGYGPMASSSKRFRTRTHYTGPGPGAYKERLPQDVMVTNSSAPATSAFMPKLMPKVQTSASLVIPGPGAYACEEVTRTGANLDYLSKPGAGAVSAFKSGAHALQLAGNPDCPPLGTYNVPLSTLNTKGYSSGGHGGGSPPSSSFGTGGRGGGGGGGGASSMGSLQPSLFTDMNRLIYGPNATPVTVDSGPGPGQYELQDYASIKHKVESAHAKATSVFVKSEVLDRFGRRLSTSNTDPFLPPMDSVAQVVRIRGPTRSFTNANAAVSAAAASGLTSSRSNAALEAREKVSRTVATAVGALRDNLRSRSAERSYNSDEGGARGVPVSPQKGVGAPFKSKTPGHAEIIDLNSYQTSANAPGPAYYQPQKPGKKSFHLNAGRKFSR